MNELLQQENAKLKRQARDVAEANAHAAELMVQREEAEDQLRRAYDEMEARVRERTAELTAVNDELAKEIRERQGIEQTLRENEQRLNTVLHDILTGVLIVDAETREITDVNPHAAEIIGLPGEEIIGKICHKFVCPAEQGSCPIADLHQTVDQSERVLLRADGRRAPILKTVTSAQWQGHRYFIESFIDMSERKQGEEDLKESLSLLEATLESTADGILVVSCDGTIKNVNRKFKDLWRIPDDLLASAHCHQALPFMLGQLKEPDSFVARINELMNRPDQESFDTVELLDGRVFERCSKPHVVGDAIVGRVWSFRDVTEQHHALQKQEALMRQVAAVNEELTHFAYIVSHDLKAPLRGIKLLTEWLCTDYGDKLGDDAKQQLDLLQSRVGRMHNLIEGILQYSRVGRVKEDRVRIDLNVLMDNIVDAIAPPEHVRISIQGPLPTIIAEKTRVSQVFQNLITNAVKYMDKPQGQITVTCVEDGNAWKFSVTDNGPGIEEKYFERIFRIFQTLAPRDEFESTGVGLTLVKKIVELYGGKVWVESVVGQGSTFHFTLPKQSSAAGSQPAADQDEDTEGNMTAS
ncbi:MAG: PAS domain S-box protein [Sedimentisphaerales bacterium]|nr:PAS domain S-box protein [Sedimentisphaerales bacterium]